MSSPYPYATLPKLTRIQARALPLLHALISDIALDAALRCLDALLGVRVACELGTPEPCSDAQFRARAARPAVWVELDSPDHSAWLELPIGLCEFIADRALGGDGPFDLTASGPALDELSLGAVAYVVARAAAAANSTFRLRMLGMSPPPSGATTELLRCGAALRPGDAQTALQFYAPAALFRAARAKRPARRRFDALALPLWADAGYARLRTATLRSLQCGDVLVLDRASLSRDANAGFRGTVAVRVEGSASAFLCRVRGDRLEVETIACTPEPSMTSGRRIPQAPDAPSVELARDAPIEVSLEIARFRVTLGELERVRPGDVFTTGRRVGERVTLRAAGQSIAEGELVEVEGELGVRITRLLPEAD